MVAALTNVSVRMANSHVGDIKEHRIASDERPIDLTLDDRSVFFENRIELHRWTSSVRRSDIGTREGDVLFFHELEDGILTALASQP